jgi:hypothetical protein
VVVEQVETTPSLLDKLVYMQLVEEVVGVLLLVVLREVPRLAVPVS